MRTLRFIQLLAILVATPAALAIPMRIDKAREASAASALPPEGITGEMNDMMHGAERLRQQDPLKALSCEMGGIADDLQQQQTGEPVQGEQKHVVSQLDKLIEELNRQCNGKSGMSNNPTKPLADSKIVKGPGGSGPMHDPQAGVKSWGELPAKERDKILQSQNDGFPAGYEALLSSYYNRLSQEQVGDEGKSAAAPATQP